MTAVGQAPAGSRVHAFDALRCFSILGIFTWHAGLSYAQPGLGLWPVEDPKAQMGFTAALWFTRGFRLAIFFVMSGFFARLMLQRSDPATFVRQRLLRLGLPFVLGLALFNALTWWAPDPLNAWGPVGGYWPPTGWRPLHLWFLAALLVISLVVLALAWGLPRVCPRGLVVGTRAAFGRLLKRWWGPLVPAVVSVIFLHLQGGQYPLAPPRELLPEALTLAYFGCFYVCGWWLHQQLDTLAALCRFAWGWVAAGLLLRVLTAVALLPELSLERVPDLLPRDLLLLQMASDVYAWLMVFGLMGVFQRLFRREIPLVRWLSDGAYWLYIVHLIPVMGLQWWLAGSGLGWGAGARFVLVTVVSLAAILISYEWAVRYTIIGRLLTGPRTKPVDGRRQCWRWRSPRPAS